MSRRTERRGHPSAPAPALPAALLAAVLALAGPSPAPAEVKSPGPDLAWLDRSALAAGEVPVQTDKHGATVGVDTAVLVHAPAEAIWGVLTSCSLAPEYVPNVVSCRSIERIEDGRAELFVQTVKPAFFLPRFEHVFRLDYHPYRRIDVHEISGPIRHLEASWWLLPQPQNATLLVYSLEVDPGFPVPRFVVRAALKRDVPRIMAAVRERAEAAAGR